MAEYLLMNRYVKQYLEKFANNPANGTFGTQQNPFMRARLPFAGLGASQPPFSMPNPISIPSPGPVAGTVPAPAPKPLQMQAAPTLSSGTQGLLDSHNQKNQTVSNAQNMGLSSAGLLAESAENQHSQNVNSFLPDVNSIMGQATPQAIGTPPPKPSAPIESTQVADSFLPDVGSMVASATPQPVGGRPQPSPSTQVAQPSGPTQEQIAQFQKGTASKFNPNSWVDRNKMNALMQGNARWADNSAARSIGANQQYAWNTPTGGRKAASQGRFNKYAQAYFGTLLKVSGDPATKPQTVVDSSIGPVTVKQVPNPKLIMPSKKQMVDEGKMDLINYKK